MRMLTHAELRHVGGSDGSSGPKPTPNPVSCPSGFHYESSRRTASYDAETSVFGSLIKTYAAEAKVGANGQVSISAGFDGCVVNGRSSIPTYPSAPSTSPPPPKPSVG